jgi:hypothetical protein
LIYLATEKKRASSRREEAKPVDRLIYVGPPLPGGKLNSFSIFKGGIPKYLDALIKEQPDLSALIVPVGEFARAREEVNTLGTALHAAYQNVLKGDQ